MIDIVGRHVLERLVMALCAVVWVAPRSSTPTFSNRFAYVTGRRRTSMPSSPRVRRADPPDPDLMTPADRRAEVAAILAVGFLRLRLNQTKKREILLDVLRRSSDQCLEPESEGEIRMSDSIVTQIAGLHRLTGAQLKERWRELHGTEPPGAGEQGAVRQ
jgi:hypothetical protein